MRPGAIPSWLVMLVALASCGERTRTTPVRPATKPGPRISMAALHATGGIPPGWRLTPPPGDRAAGRAAFVDLGCPACHVVAGESFGTPPAPGDAKGPELTGMGGHHPPEYFVEAILSPDAVLVDGPGYVGPDGHSIMPGYPEMTLGQLTDLVAYLISLGGAHPPMPRGSVTPLPAWAVAQMTESGPLPTAPATDDQAFLTMTYAIREGRLDSFAQWLRDKGMAGFLGFPGLRHIDTWVDRTRSPSVTTVVSFASREDRDRFERDASMGRLGLEFDGFIGDHDHSPFDEGPPIYRAPDFSSPRP